MNKDPFQYFRIEARELLEGITQGVLELERGGGPDQIAALLRLAHTLKGAARVVKRPAIAELAHAVEEVLTPYRQDAGPVSPGGIAELLRLADGIGLQLAALDPPTPGQSAAKPARTALEEVQETVRVEVEEVHAVLESLAAGSAHLARMRQQFAAIEHARRLARAGMDHGKNQAKLLQGNGASSAGGRDAWDEVRACLDRLDRDLTASLDQAERELTQARERAEHLRLQNAANLFPSLARAARDTAHALGKRVEFEAVGGELRLDAHVLLALRDALLHLVNNGVAHGIERPEIRATAGKPAAGRIELRIERHGGSILFSCGDDGGGIDVEAIRRVAAQRGAIPAARVAALSLNEAIGLLLRGGISTTGTITEVAGRGIGLDIVRAAAARLRGEVGIESTLGRGTTVQIRVPVSLASLPALVVESEGMTTVLPLDAVRQSLLITGSDLVGAGTSLTVAHEGKMIPFLPLHRALGRPSSGAHRRRRWVAVLVAAGEEMAMIGVDRLHGVETVLVRRLPEVAAAEAVVAGASLDGSGNTRLVLDPAGLIEASRRAPAPDAESAPSPHWPILVIDDSLTTRMLEQSILESAGYAVEVATSAEEALEKATARRYSLFLVDVEMPGMDGFAFVAKTRADPGLRGTPAILVTSRNAQEDRRRGEQAGAAAYIVKSEFDQVYLLQTIRRLVQQP